ncbi:tyrosine-type recombinase/integrase [Parasphingorhabdus sp.]|uniref:tyrosine-type recombinase/integrase n=1 Tax=Parasphingorhabdus sp. TaxID=2709688 RepID=UPI003593FCA1
MSPITISEACTIWLDRCQLEKLERATIHSYSSHVTHHIIPNIGSIKLADLTAADVRQFLDAILRDSTRSNAKKALTSLRSLISEVQERGFVQHNVARDVKLRQSTRHEPERVFPSKEEIRLLIAKVSPRYRPFIVTAIMTGMRMSELRGLRWSDVDFKHNLISIRQRADRYNELGVPKSKAGRRDIPMGGFLSKILQSWIEHCPKGVDDLVFPNGVGRVQNHSNFYNRVFRPLMVECGIVGDDGKPSFSPHSLRHAAASLFIEQGWPPKKIQTLLGHSTIMMTFDVYGHLFNDPSKDVELMDKMEQDLLAA